MTESSHHAQRYLASQVGNLWSGKTLTSRAELFWVAAKETSSEVLVYVEGNGFQNTSRP